MISISNADRDKAVEFIRAYASMLHEQVVRTTKVANEHRMAINLANKLNRKKPLPVGVKPDRKQTTNNRKDK